MTEKPPWGWVSAYARHAGCDKSYVSRLVKRGMPFDSSPNVSEWAFESADRWRAANASEGVGHKSVGHNNAPVEAAGRGLLNSELNEKVSLALNTPVCSAIGNVSGDGIESMAARACESEIEAYNALSVAYKNSKTPERKGLSAGEVAEVRMNAASSLPGLLRTYTQAARARLDVEKRVLELSVESGKFASVDDLWRLISDVLAPLAEGLKQMPKKTSSRCDRGDRNYIEQIVGDEVNELISRMNKVLSKEGV